ncbi:MAG: FHA domain-containing protein [Limisphaerales bacterium]
MAKLVVVTEGLKGLSHELAVERTTVGRVEDNTFQIGEPSVSSHHAEVLLKGTDVVIKDLNSTNGTFINGEKVTEAVLKPGQTVRFGQIELRLEGAASGKKQLDATRVIPAGVKREDVGTSGGTVTAADRGFAKKSDKAGKIVWVAVGVVLAIIAGILIFVFLQTGSAPP